MARGGDCGDCGGGDEAGEDVGEKQTFPLNPDQGKAIYQINPQYNEKNKAARNFSFNPEVRLTRAQLVPGRRPRTHDFPADSHRDLRGNTRWRAHRRRVDFSDKAKTPPKSRFSRI